MATKKMEASFLGGVIRGDGYELILGRFWLDTRGKVFTEKIIIPCNNLSWEVVDSPIFDTFKI